MTNKKYMKWLLELANQEYKGSISQALANVKQYYILE